MGLIWIESESVPALMDVHKTRNDAAVMGRMSTSASLEVRMSFVSLWDSFADMHYIHYINQASFSYATNYAGSTRGDSEVVRRVNAKG